MKHFFLAFFIFFSLTAQSAEKSFHVLVTSFEKMYNHQDNMSRLVAIRLEALGFDHCILPVSFKRAQDVFKKCFQKRKKWHMVLSLGEGLSYSEVPSYDIMAKNFKRSSFTEDLDGMTLKGDGKLGERDHFYQSPLSSYMCSREKEQLQKMSVSLHSGEWVCAYTAYFLQQFLRPKAVAFQFVHLPAYSYVENPAEMANSLADELSLFLQYARTHQKNLRRSNSRLSPKEKYSSFTLTFKNQALEELQASVCPVQGK
jgi:pyrrolidone-carboxylate peptidase